jgi:hypothetical protein
LILLFPLGWLGQALKIDVMICLVAITFPVVSIYLWSGCKRNKRTIEWKISELQIDKQKLGERDQSILVGHCGCCPLCGATLFQIGVKGNCHLDFSTASSVVNKLSLCRVIRFL